MFLVNVHLWRYNASCVRAARRCTRSDQLLLCDLIGWWVHWRYGYPEPGPHILRDGFATQCTLATTLGKHALAMEDVATLELYVVLRRCIHNLEADRTGGLRCAIDGHCLVAGRVFSFECTEGISLL